MNQIREAQLAHDRRLPLAAIKTPQQLARSEWLRNAAEQLIVFGADVKFKRRLHAAQGVTWKDFTLAVDEHVSGRLKDCQIETSAFGLLVISAWQLRRPEKTCAIELLGDSDHEFGMLGEIAEALLEPLANDALIAQAEDDLL
jgi:hypothetical protein